MSNKAIQQVFGRKQSALHVYKEMHVGDEGWLFFAYYELCMLMLKNMQGALGLLLRTFFYRRLFGGCGRNVVIAAGVTIRNPKKIVIGDNVVMDEGCVIDAKGETGKGVNIGEEVFISRNVVLSCKNGGITLGNSLSIGPYSGVYSVDDCEVSIGDYCIISAYCYFVGSGDYSSSSVETPFIIQGLKKGRPIRVEQNVWLGGYVEVMEGVTIGRDTIVGAKSLVKKDIPPRSVAYGIPAQVQRSRV